MSLSHWRHPPQVAPSWLSPMDARSRSALPDAAPLPSLPPPSLVSSLFPPLPPSGQGPVAARCPRVEGFVPVPWWPPFQHWLLVTPNQIRAVGLVCLLYPRSAAIGLDAVAPGVAETELGCVRGTPERLGDVASLPYAVWGSPCLDQHHLWAPPAHLPTDCSPMPELLLPVVPPHCRKPRQRGA